MPTSVTHQGHTPGARLPSQIARSGVRTPGGSYGSVSILPAWSWAVADFTNP